MHEGVSSDDQAKPVWGGKAERKRQAKQCVPLDGVALERPDLCWDQMCLLGKLQENPQLQDHTPPVSDESPLSCQHPECMQVPGFIQQKP